MKSVSGKAFVATIVIGVVLIGIAFWGGMQTYSMKHECTVDKATGKATCKA